MSGIQASRDLAPQLPPGDISALSTLSQSFSFHSSPESFISSRAKNVSSQQPGQVQGGESSLPIPQIVRARILNRNVAVISSHQICEDVLRAESGLPQESFKAAASGGSVGSGTFTVNAAYHQLMSDFFPPPNILLIDRPDHVEKRKAWDEQLSSLPTDASESIREIAEDHFRSWRQGDTLDIYESMKDLSWRLLLAIFLQLSPADKNYAAVETLQEILLRGQFSLFPVAVNTPFWRSPRSKGIEARKKLQVLLAEHIPSMDAACPFMKQQKVDNDELSSNTLLFTSSIAVKALASLLAASILNLFLLPCTPSLASRVQSEDATNREILLNSILLETERLSPPVVGVMRRVNQDIIFCSPEGQPPVLVPAGWDVWLYFVGAARDGALYHMADEFVPERFVSSGTRGGLAFGGGAKTCLGRDVVRQMVKTVADVALELGIRLEGTVGAEGVRGWLGWDAEVSPSAYARDLKQLPCQRPREAIQVHVYRDRERIPPINA